MDEIVRLTVIAPACNEQDNIGPLVREVGAVFDACGLDAELIIVDDGSTDQTRSTCRRLMRERAWLRLIALNTNCGQSAAFAAGIRAARGELIGMLDADMQNDPADLARYVTLIDDQNADWVQGVRSQRNDRDRTVRALSSWVGRVFRRTMLGDTIRDTGCSCRVFRREIGLQLPLQYRGVHRFMPAYARRLGYKVIEAEAHHRPRAAGTTKYGAFTRAIPGLRDLFAMRWMFNRLRNADAVEITADKEAVENPSLETTHV